MQASDRCRSGRSTRAATLNARLDERFDPADAGMVQDPYPAYDITRRGLRILSFGGGIHQCICQQLARLEGKIAFTEVASRIPEMRLDTLAARWRPGFLFRGLTGLHAAW
jgi:cytochrome P450